MAVFRLGIHADGFQGNRRDYVFFQSVRTLCVDPAAHGGRPEIRRFFIGKGDEADRSCWSCILEFARDFNKGRNAGTVVVRARATIDAVVVRANDDDFLWTRCAADFRRNVLGSLAFDVVLLLLDSVAKPF